MPSTITVTKLTDLVISVSNDGVITISYTGQTSITNSANTYYKWYTYGVLGNGTNPLTFVSVACSAPSGLKSESYQNNGSLALSLGTDAGGNYVVTGAGDIRPSNVFTAISVNVDNHTLNSGSGTYPNYLIQRTTSSGTILTLYHP